MLPTFFSVVYTISLISEKEKNGQKQGKKQLKVLYHRQCQYTQANEYHFDGANSIETTNH